MGACRYITKNGHNDFHGYSYVTSADVIEKVNTAFLEVGLVTSVHTTLLDLREVPNAKGNVDKHATIQVDITITDIDSGESLVFSGIGSGQDSGDKATMKASTAAQKYALMMSLLIATGDDPEADKSIDENADITPQPQRQTNKANTVYQKRSAPQTSSEFTCKDCGTRLTPKVHSYSINNYGEPLCMNCQKKHQSVA